MRLPTRILAPSALLLAFLAPAASATAAPPESERYQTITGDVNTCNGESVVVNGTAHTATQARNNGTLVYRFTLQGKGVGSRGNEYVFHTSYSITATDSGFNVDERTLLISKGSAPNDSFLLHFDGAGNVTVKTDCRG